MDLKELQWDCPVSGIYKLTSPNGKSYIGKTTNLYARLNQYKNLHCKNQTYLYHAIKKYGWENFKVELLEQVEDEDLDILDTTLNELEIKYIAEFRVTERDKGYNISSGGEGGRLTEETKRKIGEGNRGKILSAETKEKISKARMGTVFTEETKRRMSEARVGIKLAEETKKKMSETRLKMSPKDRRKMSKEVNQLDLQGNFIKSWGSLKEAAIGVGLKSSSGISAACKDTQKTSKGFKWEYKIK